MKIIIFGCGQGGQTLGNLLSASVRLLAFADNNPQTSLSKIQRPPPLYYRSFRSWDTQALCRISPLSWIR